MYSVGENGLLSVCPFMCLHFLEAQTCSEIMFHQLYGIPQPRQFGTKNPNHVLIYLMVFSILWSMKLCKIRLTRQTGILSTKRWIRLIEKEATEKSPGQVRCIHSCMATGDFWVSGRAQDDPVISQGWAGCYWLILLLHLTIGRLVETQKAEL